MLMCFYNKWERLSATGYMCWCNCQLDKLVLCKHDHILSNILFCHTYSHTVYYYYKDVLLFFCRLEFLVPPSREFALFVFAVATDLHIYIPYDDTMKVCMKKNNTHAPSVVGNSTTKAVCFIILNKNTVVQSENRHPIAWRSTNYIIIFSFIIRVSFRWINFDWFYSTWRHS